MLSEYGWPVDYALERPLAQLLALYSAIAARYGHTPAGPTFAQRHVLTAIDNASSGKEAKEGLA